MSALHDQELADVLEAERLKRARRVRQACDSTVPSINPDDVAARILHTIEELKLSASGGLAGPAGRPRRRGKEAPPFPRTPTTIPTATNGTETPARIRRASRVSGAPPDHSPIQSARDERSDSTTNGGANGHQRD